MADNAIEIIGECCVHHTPTSPAKRVHKQHNIAK